VRERERGRGDTARGAESERQSERQRERERGDTARGRESEREPEKRRERETLCCVVCDYECVCVCVCVGVCECACVCVCVSVWAYVLCVYLRTALVVLSTAPPQDVDTFTRTVFV